MTNVRAPLIALVLSAITVDAPSAQAEVEAGLCPRPKQLSIVPGGEPADLSRGARVISLSEADGRIAGAAGRLRSEMDKLRTSGSAAEPGVTITVGLLADWRRAGKERAFAEGQLEAIAG